MKRLRALIQRLRRQRQPQPTAVSEPVLSDEELLEEYRRAGIPEPILALGVDVLKKQLGGRNPADLQLWNEHIRKSHRPSQGMLASLPDKPR